MCVHGSKGIVQQIDFSVLIHSSCKCYSLLLASTQVDTLQVQRKKINHGVFNECTDYARAFADLWWALFIHNGTKGRGKKLTFSPISVWSPAGRTDKSWARAQASTSSLYLCWTKGLSKRMFFCSVLFCIQASCETYATSP